MLTDYIKIARFDHWIKNIFVLPGIVTALVLFPGSPDFATIAINTVVVMLAVGCTASANYTINEWLDSGFDRFHPVKSARPGAQNRLVPVYVLFQYAILAALGLGLSLWIGVDVLVWNGALLTMGIIYNVPPARSKDRPYIDVLSESINNPLRFIIGWSVVIHEQFPPSSIIICYWMGGAFLMGVKRYAEYRRIDNPQLAASYRKSFRYYNEKTLILSSLFYALVSALFLGIFLVKYRAEYILSFPLFAWLFVTYLSMGMNQDSSAQAPEKLYKEKKLMLTSFLLVVLLVVLSLVDIPFLHQLSEPTRY